MHSKHELYNMLKYDTIYMLSIDDNFYSNYLVLTNSEENAKETLIEASVQNLIGVTNFIDTDIQVNAFIKIKEILEVEVSEDSIYTPYGILLYWALWTE